MLEVIRHITWMLAGCWLEVVNEELEVGEFSSYCAKFSTYILIT